MKKEKEDITVWLTEQFGTDVNTIMKALKLSPSAQGYIHGAISEIILIEYLKSEKYEVTRIKEKPAGGFDKKKIGYKGDFLIKKRDEENYYVVECKGLKTNAEFRAATTDDEHLKNLTKKQAYNCLKKFVNIDKEKTYQKGLKNYLKSKQYWESHHKGKFPEFNWTKQNPGPDNADLRSYFTSLDELKKFINACDDELLSEKAFRSGKGLYKLLQTHKPSGRVDFKTGIEQAAPLASDFSLLAVDLFQRTGKHEFVFMNPDTISHSPTSPNHLYQNYIIDVLIPGVKEELDIKHPWYLSIDECIKKTSPRKVEYDASQLDYREG